MAKKRSFQEIENLEDIKDTASSTTLHGAITTLSPIKKGRKSIFFDGAIADSTAMIRLVGFNPVQQRKLQEIQEKKLPVELSNCEVKRSRYGPGYEAMLKGSSVIRVSHRTGIDVPVILAENVTTVPQSSEIVLAELSAMEIYSKVTIIGAKAVEIKDEQQLIERRKQDVIIADGTGNAKVTLWDEQIGCLETGRSYQFKEFVVRIFQSNKYLSKGDTSEIIAVGDIGPVFGASSETSEDCIEFTNVIIVGVPELDTYKMCFRCRSRVESSTPQLGRCTRFDCQMLQRFDICQDVTTAKLVITYGCDQSQRKFMQVSVHGEKLLAEMSGVLSAENGGPMITQELLLASKTIKKMTIVKDTKIVRSVCCN